MLALKRQKWHCALKTVFSCELLFCVCHLSPMALDAFQPLATWGAVQYAAACISGGIGAHGGLVGL
jgi:hypothetical protein